MDRAAANYRDGEMTGFESLAGLVTTELAYIVEVEHIRAKIGGKLTRRRGTASDERLAA
jgi:hypothetical protein